jgi:UDP-N-acetyl-D-mannosaminuronate dehydrogenase
LCTADIIFVSVNTPTKTSGIGAGKAADLSYWESAARLIAGACKGSAFKVVVEKSTVPVKTAEAIGKVCAGGACVGHACRQRCSVRDSTTAHACRHVRTRWQSHARTRVYAWLCAGAARKRRRRRAL